LLISSLVIMTYVVLLVVKPHPFQHPLIWAFAAVIVVTWLLIFIQALFIALISLLSILRFGQQPARGRTAFVRVTSEATPLGVWEVETFPATGFAHSEIHENPRVAEAIAEWVTREDRRVHRASGA
jgi:hypothetical protein